MDDIREQIRELLDEDLTFALSVIYDGDQDGAALVIKQFARKVRAVIEVDGKNRSPGDDGG
ncbi:MAG: hypothetical protein ABW006_07310 [Hyphomicrobium sp.]